MLYVLHQYRQVCHHALVEFRIAVRGGVSRRRRRSFGAIFLQRRMPRTQGWRAHAQIQNGETPGHDGGVL